MNINTGEITSFTLNTKNTNLNLKVGERININILKSLGSDLYLVNIKGKLLNAAFKSQPILSKYIGEVVSTEPFIEIKLSKEESATLTQLKRYLVNFNKDFIKNILNNIKENSLNELSHLELKRVIKDSGLLFESKLLKDELLEKDLKYFAFKNNDVDLLSSITKLQVATIITQALFFTFSAKDFGIEDAELIYKKGKILQRLLLKVSFTNLRDVLIDVTLRGKNVFGIVKSREDISEYLKMINVENIDIKWEKLKADDFEQFDIFKNALRNVGNFQVYG